MKKAISMTVISVMLISIFAMFGSSSAFANTGPVTIDPTFLRYNVKKLPVKKNKYKYTFEFEKMETACGKYKSKKWKKTKFVIKDLSTGKKKTIQHNRKASFTTTLPRSCTTYTFSISGYFKLFQDGKIIKWKWVPLQAKMKSSNKKVKLKNCRFNILKK